VTLTLPKILPAVTISYYNENPSALSLFLNSWINRNAICQISRLSDYYRHKRLCRYRSL